MSKKNCDICCEHFTTFKRKEIACQFCKKTACTQCIQTYLLESIHEPHCMYCRKVYTWDFQSRNFTKSLVNKFKTHASEIHFEEEKALLPEAQAHLKKIAHCEEIARQIYDLRITIQTMERERYNILNGTIKLEKVKIVRQCPENDCRGFLSTKWKCGVCHKKFCNKCHDQLEQDHVCDEDKLKSATLIRKQCKNCPSCGVSTFKISGCPQMWCTSCNKAWNWNTGRIEKGIIHNPHYFQYLASQGENVPRNPGDVRCGGVPTFIYLRQHLHFNHRWISGDIRFINHINGYEIQRLDRFINKTNLDLRIKYLKNQITDKKFKSTLKRRQTKRIKSTELKDIFTMFWRACSDLIVNLTQHIQFRKIIYNSYCEEYSSQIKPLIEYTNKHFKLFGKRYNTQYNIIERHPRRNELIIKSEKYEK